MDNARPDKPPLKERLKQLLSEYGSIALVVYLVLFAAVFAGFFVAISLGVRTDGTAEGLGTAAAAWLATKLTQPLRIGGTLVLTPVVGLLLAKLRGRGKGGAGPAD